MPFTWFFEAFLITSKAVPQMTPVIGQFTSAEGRGKLRFCWREGSGVLREKHSVENITQCLSFIGELGVSIEGVTSKDVREGNLKVILSLFFNLSRYKQAQKNSSSVASKNSANSAVTSSAASTNVNTAAVVKSGMVAPSLGSDMLSKLPSPFRPSSGRSIPCPSNKDAGSSIPSSSNPSAAAGSRKNKLVASSVGQQDLSNLLVLIKESLTV
ncbi:hypothetical protein AVEN_127129-1 [Araneus ventricosus]|uniref:Calponin-homology (CH) domain-containing protein n=1 Tax=Araneus ventricosus TaxID=182803 RepID=A0A4Y2UGZ1_ARAVE|nr:hypothetical protein AVEN_127129-1 [Araneus ventricosus]